VAVNKVCNALRIKSLPGHIVCTKMFGEKLAKAVFPN
jgi:hypothetical protein